MPIIGITLPSVCMSVEDEHGNVKKNSVDEMAGRDSGGEGTEPEIRRTACGICNAVHAAEQQRSKDSSGASG